VYLAGQTEESRLGVGRWGSGGGGKRDNKQREQNKKKRPKGMKTQHLPRDKRQFKRA